jgi:hypothetical protein
MIITGAAQMKWGTLLCNTGRRRLAGIISILGPGDPGGRGRPQRQPSWR